MPCGGSMVGRVDNRAAGAPRLGIVAERPCIGGGPVAPRDDDRRRLRSVGALALWAVVAVGAAITLVTAL